MILTTSLMILTTSRTKITIPEITQAWGQKTAQNCQQTAEFVSCLRQDHWYSLLVVEPLIDPPAYEPHGREALCHILDALGRCNQVDEDDALEGNACAKDGEGTKDEREGHAAAQPGGTYRGPPTPR